MRRRGREKVPFASFDRSIDRSTLSFLAVCCFVAKEKKKEIKHASIIICFESFSKSKKASSLVIEIFARARFEKIRTEL